ncbi:MAG TPA: FtsX-like permease family protein [Phycisphaerae bacterium]|nr:FtsX-like permease family protein [Phycisphaerae bacterium]HRY69604.1 FtsX-like permease family protein [Phycisphaerae bacterium]HSA27281.1 FtsX-like permease family protein [Phycisphaerae bacterium]
MRHWWQLGTRNWRARPGRTAGALAAIALGVGVVIWVTCAYESVRLALRDQVWLWVGKSHAAIESGYGADGNVFQSVSEEVRKIPNVKHVTYQLKRRMLLRRFDPTTSRPETDLPLAVPTSQPPPLASLPADVAFDDEADPSMLDQLVQAIGIEPDFEYIFRDYDQERVEGRMLRQDDTDAAVVDYQFANMLGLKLGDKFTLRAAALNEYDRPTESVAVFTVVGTLKHRRVAKTQRPVVLAKLDRIQALSGYGRDPKRVTKIDVILENTTDQAIVRAESNLSMIVRKYQEGYLVTSSRAKMRQVQMAQDQTGVVMGMFSTVALFTALFTILSTLSMGMVERIGQMGTLRCLGMTRVQMALLVLGEALPTGMVGILLGIPVGLGLAKMSVWLAPEYIGELAINKTGLALALAGGLATTLAGALLPMMQALRVSPLAASRPQAQPPSGILAWLAALLGVAMIVTHSVMLVRIPANQWFLKPHLSFIGVGLLFTGYGLIMPLTIRLVGPLAVHLMTVVLALPRRLLGDQIGRAVWRSSAICCGLMVGLSLIVTLVVLSASLAAGWDFPKNFCEAFVYTLPPIDWTVADQARRTEGVRNSNIQGKEECALINTGIKCRTIGAGLFDFPVSLFVAGDPEEFFRIAKLEFVEGSRDEAEAKLKRGGYILVTPEFVRTKKKTYKDKVLVRQGALFGQGRYFEIAGVVTSPALDIAANYFNAGDMLVAAAVHVVLGTLDDASKVFGLPRQASLFLVNFDIPFSANVPPEFKQTRPPLTSDPLRMVNQLRSWAPLMPERKAEIDSIMGDIENRQASAGSRAAWDQVPLLRLFREALTPQLAPPWPDLTPEERWQTYREELVMRLIARRTGSSNTMHASVRALKSQIDHDLGRATRLCSAIPIVALIVAALGVANLMMANVTNRIRQIAMLRSVGATRWQITRLVIGEALVLGVLGSLIGVALGMHAAFGINAMTEAIWGFRPEATVPWGWLSLAIGLTLSVCLIAGVLPARRAAGTNIIDALRTT